MPPRCGRDKTPPDRAQGWTCTRAMGHSGPCAMVPPPTPVHPALLELPRPFTPTEEFNRNLEHWQMADELEAKILAERDANPAPVPVKVRSRWFRLMKFPVTVRKFERVFAAQGEPLVWRWIRAAMMARVTIR